MNARAGLAALIVAVFASGSAAADCSDYGALAVAQQQENVALGCGFTGLRWHVDGAAHAGFCTLVGESAAAAESSVREEALAGCRARAEVADPEPEPEPQGGECIRSEVAEGKGETRERARGAAIEKLGRERAEALNQGLSCRFNDLGCVGDQPNMTCYLSLYCCPD